MKITMCLSAVLLATGCNHQEQTTVEISHTTYRSDAPKFVYNISDLKAQAPKAPVDISGTWLGSTQYSPTVNLAYELVIDRKGDDYIVVSFTDANNGMNLDIRNFYLDYPVISFEADSSLFDGHMIPQPFKAEFVVLGHVIKGHFRQVKSQNSKTTTYFNYDTDFRRAN